MQEIFIEILKAILTAITSTFFALFATEFYINYKKREKEKNHSLDVVVAIHHEINEVILDILHDLHADRTLVFQTENGRYFLGGTPLMKLIPTNEKTSKGLERFKDRVDEVKVGDWEEALTNLKKNEGVLTISASNQYEGLIDSRIILKQRGCNSGIYILFRKKFYGQDKPTGLLCIEYKDENPTFTQEQIFSLCAEKIQKVRSLINQKAELRFKE